MRKLALTLMISAFAVVATAKSSWEMSGEDYELLTAANKESQLWREVTSNQTPYGWYSSIRLGELFVESMSPTLEHVGDTFENGWLGVRNKYIHSVGNVAQVAFQPVENDEGYTGIFKSGADHGLIRLSIAKAPSESKKTAKQAYDNFTPGFGLKFLRDGVHSGNLVAMYGVNGAESWNFFKMDFSNHIGAAEGIALNLVAKKFSSGTPFIQYVGLSDIAQYDQHGNEVAAPKFPFQLVFEPTLRENYGDDFVETFQDQLQKIPANTLLYKVFAFKEPGAPKVHIGDLVMKTQCVPSYFGDKYLFFKHQDMREDLKLKPEWETHLDSVSLNNPSCPFKMAKSYFGILFQRFVKSVFKGVL